MTFLIYALIAAAVLLGIMLSVRGMFSKSGKHQLEDEPAPDALEQLSVHELRSVKPGDIIEYFNETYIVDSKWEYREDSYVWYEFMIVSGEQKLWLSIEEDEEFEIYLGEKIKDMEVEFQSKPPSTINYKNDTFKLDEQGKALVRREKDGETKEMGVCHYFDYEGKDDQYITIEAWGDGGEKEFTLSKKIPESWLKIYPK